MLIDKYVSKYLLTCFEFISTESDLIKMNKYGTNPALYRNAKKYFYLSDLKLKFSEAMQFKLSFLSFGNQYKALLDV